MLAGFGPQYGLSEELALRLGRAFGGGVGMGLPCGAVLGALMILGLKDDWSEESDRQVRSDVYEMCQEFKRRFQEKNQSIWCRELLGVDLGTKEGVKEAKKKKLFVTHCPVYVQDAGEILEAILGDTQKA